MVFQAVFLGALKFWESAWSLFWGVEEGEYGFSFPASVRAALLLSVLETEVLGKIDLVGTPGPLVPLCLAPEQESRGGHLLSK